MQLHYDEIKDGDNSGLLRYLVLFKGKPIVIHELTVVTFRMVDRDSGEVIVDDKSGLVLVDEPGVVGYQREVAEVTGPRTNICEFLLVFPSLQQHRSPDIVLPIIAAL